jgi:hypothetical protein
MKFARSLCASLLLLGGLVGCRDSTGAARAKPYAEAVYKAIQQLEEKGRAFGTALAEVLQGKYGAADRLRLAHKEWQEALEEVRPKIARELAPDDPSGQRFSEEAEKFLEEQDSALKGPLAEVVALAADSTTPLADKQRRMQEKVEQVAKAEKAELDVLKEAQKAFATDHRLELKNSPAK